MITDGFDSPVGTADERRGAQVPPQGWLDATPYGTFYTVVPEHWENGQLIPARNAFHPGADLNLPKDKDAHAPVYAVAHGVVTYAQMGSGSWGKLVCIEHALPTGAKVYSRYAHLESIGVQKGQSVQRGDEIGRIGNSENRFPYHLHLDISTNDTLRRNPEDWNGTDEARLKRDYVPPLAFIRSNRPTMQQPQQPPVITPVDMIKAAQDALAQANAALVQALAALTPATPTPDLPPATTPTQAQVAAADGVNVRAAPTVKAKKAGSLASGTVISVLDDIQADGYQWCKILSGEFAGCYVAKPFLAFDVAAADAVAVG